LIDLDTLKDLNIIVVDAIDYLIDNAKEDKEEYNKDIALKLQIWYIPFFNAFTLNKR